MANEMTIKPDTIFAIIIRFSITPPYSENLHSFVTQLSQFLEILL